MSCDVTDMQVIRRDDVSFDLTFTDVDGDPINLTGATVFFTVKKRATDPDDEAEISKSITSFDDPTSGVALLELTTSDTDMSAGRYLFDIQLKTVDGKIVSSTAGNFLVTQDITVRTS